MQPTPQAELLDGIVAAAKAEARASAEKHRLVGLLFESVFAQRRADSADLAARGGPDAGPTKDARLAHQAVEHCLSMSLGLSLTGGSRMVSLGRAMLGYPLLASAFADARIDAQQAAVIARSLPRLTDPRRRQRLVASLVGDPSDPVAKAGLIRELATARNRTVWGIPAHKLSRIIDRETALMEPESLAEAVSAIVDERKVEYWPAEPGPHPYPASLVLTGPEEAVASLYDYLDRKARAIQQQGTADGTLDQLRFDLAAGAISDGGFGLSVHYRHGPPTQTKKRAKARQVVLPMPPNHPLVHVVVPEATLNGSSTEPAMLITPKGMVPITVQSARDLVNRADSKVQTLVVDPATGYATDLRDGYTPSRQQRDLASARDGHVSRHPASGTRVCELDHVIPYNHLKPKTGGPTTRSNLASLGKADHQAKTDRLYRIQGDANDTLNFTDIAGGTHESAPYCHLEPNAAPPPDDEPPF